MGKTTLRRQFLHDRKRLDLPTYSSLCQQVQQRLNGAEVFIKARTIALYSPVNNEVATDQIFTVARDLDKRVYYPRVEGDDLVFIEVNSPDLLIPGAFGVAEPAGGNKKRIEGLDLVVVPGVAFDLHGYRLGYGRGFYDRQLAGKSAKTISVGLCFETQLCESLPTEAHDQPLDYIVTESRFIPCHF